MEKNRYIPYGYTVRNGRTVIDPAEAERIRQIFREYINGASLKEIADFLQSSKVPYTTKSCSWGKAKVARIIENGRYIGRDEYDPIIDAETYELALECKRTRNTANGVNCNQDIELIRPHVKCALCGHAMQRSVSNNCRIKEAWTCRNPECRATVRIGDENLLDRIRILINRVIKCSDLMIPRGKDKTPSAETERLGVLLSEEIAKPAADQDRIIELLNKIAEEDYNASSAKTLIAAKIAKQRVGMMTPQDRFNGLYFTDIVKTVYLGGREQIRIVTKTDSELYEGMDVE